MVNQFREGASQSGHEFGAPFDRRESPVSFTGEATADSLLAWLKDAHAMEKQAETMLSAMADRIDSYPEVRAMLQEHLQETRSQAEQLESCIVRLGGDTSTVKDLMGKFMASAQGMSGMFVSDEIVKGYMASYTFEHMEIMAYRVLIAAAELLDDAETAAVCKRILAQEERMAARLAEFAPTLTQQFLMRSETPGLDAKH